MPNKPRDSRHGDDDSGGPRDRIAELIAPLRVRPGTKVRLPRDFDPGHTGDLVNKPAGTELLQRGVAMLADYQARLAAEHRRGLLVVLQALDAAGKDGTIRHVMSGVNPQGVRVHSFKVPSAEELGHDYLWRYGSRLPARGEIAIFNRSHYEEVLVVRVHPELLDNQQLPPSVRRRDVWEHRFHAINEFERHLSENGFRIVKLFLNVSKEEQRRRLLQRIDRPEKNWKFSAADLRERQFWDDYQKAYADMLSNTSTEWAPWYVIPADHKWFARIAAAGTIVHALMELDPQFPTLDSQARRELIQLRSALEQQ
ncbi:polyphosphate kinase 2 family protein [Dactylosporangium sp. NPDC051485]|uniref:polyphosphate kinase 2 family protein n=1 Tax=Dactylosporangium sp. NPDC051485 TaxID=3154846 RepID=UPI00342787F7